MNKSISKWMLVVVVLQVLILLSSWTGSSVSVVRADGIPDQGAQQQEVINQLKSTNDKLDRLLNLLSGGDLQVKLVKPDESKEHG